MTLTNEDLQALSNLMDQKLEIESENLIREGVSRVHHILNTHIADKNVPTA